MNTLHLSKSISLPIELTTRRSAIFGVSGSGKSNTATRCIEQLLVAGEQVILIDPKGEGWGLRTSADGKKPAFDIIVFGEPHGDIRDLREQHAEQIADFAVESGRSIVLSLLGFDSDQSERRFVTAFFKRLYRLKSQLAAKTRTLVVLEEAHLFVPEQASGAVGEMVGAVKRIARQGRSAGLGLMIVDQRPQDVAKSIISQSELLICHQLIHKLDRAALSDWVKAYDRGGQGETFLDSLAELQSGQAWVWSPAWLQLFERTMIDRRQTYDSGATPDGSSAAAPKARASVDLDALKGQLAHVVEQAKANDPQTLRADVARLKKELEAAKQAAETSAHAVKEKRVEVPVVKKAELDRIDNMIGKLATAFDRASQIGAKLKEATDTLAIAVKGGLPAVQQRVVMNPVADHVSKAFVSAVLPTATKPTAPSPSPRPSPGGRGGSTDGEFVLGKGERAALTAIAQHADGVDATQLSILTGYKRSSRDAHLQRLRSAGLTDKRGEQITATPEGIAALGDSFEPLPTGAALQQHWLERLSGGERELFPLLIRVYPDALTTERLSELTNYQRSSRDAYLQRLASRKLINRERGGVVRASRNLFE